MPATIAFGFVIYDHFYRPFCFNFNSSSWFVVSVWCGRTIGSLCSVISVQCSLSFEKFGTMSALVDESTLKLQTKVKEEDPNVENDDVRSNLYFDTL
jgi:hypothetical protein